MKKGSQMFKQVDPLFVGGTELGIAFTVSDGDARELNGVVEGDKLEAVFRAIVKIAVKRELVARGKDPAFYMFDFEKARDASTRTTDYVIVASPRGLND